jgi:hypothetical protein
MYVTLLLLCLCLLLRWFVFRACFRTQQKQVWQVYHQETVEIWVCHSVAALLDFKRYLSSRNCSNTGIFFKTLLLASRSIAMMPALLERTVTNCYMYDSETITLSSNNMLRHIFLLS